MSLKEQIIIIFILVINQLDAQNFCFTINLFHASTCFEHHVLIIRRSEFYYTTSGIITPMGVKQKCCASSWLITKVNILRRTISKTKTKKKININCFILSTLHLLRLSYLSLYHGKIFTRIHSRFTLTILRHGKKGRAI